MSKWWLVHTKMYINLYTQFSLGPMLFGINNILNNPSLVRISSGIIHPCWNLFYRPNICPACQNIFVQIQVAGFWIQSCPPPRDLCLPYYLIHSWCDKQWIHAFRKGIRLTINVTNSVWNSNSVHSFLIWSW